MLVLVYEPRTGGHYLNYAGQVAAALAEVGAECHVAVAADAHQRAGYESSIGQLGSKVHVHLVEPAPVARPFASAWRRHRMLMDIIARVKPGRLYLPTADGVVQLLAGERWRRNKVFTDVQIEALLLNGSVGHSQLFSRQEYLRRRFVHWVGKRGADTVHHLNPFVRMWEEKRGIPSKSRVHTMPDPVEVVQSSRIAAREALGLPKDRRVVGMVGGLDERKGADVLVDAFAAARLSSDDMLFMFGPASHGVRSKVEQYTLRSTFAKRIVLNDRVANDDEFLTAISALDLVVLPYRNLINSSSIVIRAAAAERPVLTTGGGWAEAVIDRFPLGWTFPGPRVDALSSLLPACLDRAKDWKVTPDVAEFVRYNSRQNFAAHWTRGYRRSLGLLEDPARLDWDEMLQRRSHDA